MSANAFWEVRFSAFGLKSVFPAEKRDGGIGPVAESSITLMSLKPQSHNSTATRWTRRAGDCHYLFPESIHHTNYPRCQVAAEAWWGFSCSFGARLRRRKPSCGQTQDRPPLLTLLCIINWALQWLVTLAWWICPWWIDNKYMINQNAKSCAWRKYAAVKDKRRMCFGKRGGNCPRSSGLPDVLLKGFEGIGKLFVLYRSLLIAYSQNWFCDPKKADKKSWNAGNYSH